MFGFVKKAAKGAVKVVKKGAKATAKVATGTVNVTTKVAAAPVRAASGAVKLAARNPIVAAAASPLTAGVVAIPGVGKTTSKVLDKTAGVVEKSSKLPRAVLKTAGKATVRAPSAVAGAVKTVATNPKKVVKVIGRTASGAAKLALNPKVALFFPPAAITAAAAKNPKLTATLVGAAAAGPGGAAAGSTGSEIVDRAITTLKQNGGSEILVHAGLQGAKQYLDNDAVAYGFEVGVGIMQQPGLTAAAIDLVRNKLTPEQQKGFDMAVTAKIGEASGKAESSANPADQFINLIKAGSEVSAWERFLNWLKRPYLGKQIGVG